MRLKAPSSELARAGVPDERSAVTAAGACGRRWCSTELFGNNQQIEILHGQAVYRLRLTSLGKLILTK